MNRAHGRFFSLDVSNFYLETKFTSKDQYEYMYIPTWAIPQDIMTQYNLHEKSAKGKSLQKYELESTDNCKPDGWHI